MKAHDPEQVLGKIKIENFLNPNFWRIFEVKRTICTEGPAAMQSSNSSARAASEADARRRRGPADRRRSVHPGGGGGTGGIPHHQKCAKFFLEKKN